MDRVDYQSLVIQDLVNLDAANEIELSPWYQRRVVWTDSQKSYLINTIFEQKPVPAIYIRHSINLEKSKSIKEIVDGQQRKRTILSFYNNEFAAKHPNHTARVKFKELSQSEKQSFLLTALPVGFLLGASDTDVIDIFGRINSVSKSLNAQEKRNARYSGEMKQFCLQQASSRIEFWRTYRIFTPNDIARMNEIQFISDLVLNLLHGLSDYSSKKLDDLYSTHEEQFERSEEIEGRLDSVFDRIADIDPKLFTSTIFTRQPVFFSLFLVIDDLKKLSSKKLEKAIWDIDSRYKDDDSQREADLEFKQASTSTTQRIKQRRIRDAYIRSFL